jgi:hypothetical protein
MLRYQKLKFRTCTTPMVFFKDRDQINDLTSLDFNPMQYDNLAKAVTDSDKIITKKNFTSYIGTGTEINTGTDLQSFMLRFKKGSCRFRNILTHFRIGSTKLSQNTRIKTFFNLSGQPIVADPELKTLCSQWTVSCYPVKIREFIFKFRNNILGLNTRVSHFNNERGRHCTFCNLENGPNTDESFLHLFFECPSTKRILNLFVDNFLGELLLTDDLEKKSFIFLGSNNLTKRIDNFFISTVAVFINFYIWECKLAKKIPVLENLKNDLFFGMEPIRILSSKLRADMQLNLALCRVWRDEAGRRR